VGKVSNLTPTKLIQTEKKFKISEKGFIFCDNFCLLFGRFSFSTLRRNDEQLRAAAAVLAAAFGDGRRGHASMLQTAIQSFLHTATALLVFSPPILHWLSETFQNITAISNRLAALPPSSRTHPHIGVLHGKR
jgi:hypothetical protein